MCVILPNLKIEGATKIMKFKLGQKLIKKLSNLDFIYHVTPSISRLFNMNGGWGRGGGETRKIESPVVPNNFFMVFSSVETHLY